MSGAIDAKAFTVAAAGLERFGDQVDDVAEEVLDRMAATVVDHVQSARRRHRVTGKGERLIRAYPVGAGARRRIKVHAGGRVAHLLTGGTAPHPIRAVAAKALHLAGSTRPFAAAVRHPGTPADPFVARGVAAAMGDVDQLAAAGARELVHHLSDDLGGR